MASGVPVVQPTHGAFPELIETAGGGLLVPPGDTDALAEALHRIASDPGLGRTLGEAGWHGVRRHFTAERMAGETRKIYDSVVERMGGPVSVRA
jgi:glycosyltransferase involved in cell wall biosynthesis